MEKDQVAAYWSTEKPSAAGIQWIEVPRISRNVNLRGTGDPNLSWVDHSAQFLSHLPTPRRAISLGCGFGFLERLLRQKDICQFIDAVDIAEGAIETAHRLAAESHLDGLNYWVADLNTIELPPNTYDVIYAHASLHHTEQLEHLLDQIGKALKPNGIFISYEYTGPTQMQYPEEHLQMADKLIKLLPPAYRQDIRVGGIKEVAPRISLETMNAVDPSEAVRSAEIVELVMNRFKLHHFRNLGGSLLLLIFDSISGNFTDNDPIVDPIVDLLINLDNALIDAGVISSYHAYMICSRPDSDLAAVSSNPITGQTPSLPGQKPVEHLVADLLSSLITSGKYRQYFSLWQERGFHVIPNHFYEPVPDTRTLTEATWTKESELPGIDLNLTRQLNFLRHIFPDFADEYNAFPADKTAVSHEFYFNNGFFSGTDALVLHCMIRHFQPKRVIEVGSGFTTLITAHALQCNNNEGQLTCIEPYPDALLTQGYPGLYELKAQPIQSIEVEFFSQLQKNDILFIDTSHVIKTGGDVNYLYLEVLPRLQEGVVIHVHDIFFPYDYPKDWMLNHLRFWTEQYLLQAFLIGNDRFEVLFSNSYMAKKYLTEMQTTFPHSPWWGGGSFWMRKKIVNASAKIVRKHS